MINKGMTKYFRLLYNHFPKVLQHDISGSTPKIEFKMTVFSYNSSSSGSPCTARLLALAHAFLQYEMQEKTIKIANDIKVHPIIKNISINTPPSQNKGPV